MSAATPPNVRRWAGLGLLIVLPVVLLLLALANLATTAEVETRQATTAAQSQRYAARLRSAEDAPATPPSQDQLRLEAPSRSLAEAELQRRLVALGEGVSARIVESGSAESAPEDAAGLLEVRATFDLDNASLLRLLHAIETGLPLMTVTRLAVRSLDAGGTNSSGDPTLRAEVAVQAAWKAPVS